MSDEQRTIETSYLEGIQFVKEQIKLAQNKAMKAVNSELIMLYWKIGNIIIENSKWGNKFVEDLSNEISAAFPKIKGFSIRNLKYMKQFATLHSNFEFVQQVVAQITWSDNIVLMNKLKDGNELEWYAAKTIENGWSRNVLTHQIEAQLYHRQTIRDKSTNFPDILTPRQSELATEMLKDPYIFDFIEMRELMKEKDIENELVSKISQFLLELGRGFAFMGNQYHIEFSGKDYYIDMLFYNTILKCYFIIELKIGEFLPEHAGKLNFYLNCVDSVLKSESDNPSIGLLLCKEKDRVTVEYSLKGIAAPIGVSEYKLMPQLPKEILPSIEDLREFISQNEIDLRKYKSFHPGQFYEKSVVEELKYLAYDFMEEKPDDIRGYELWMKAYYLRSCLPITNMKISTPAFGAYAALFLRARERFTERSESAYRELVAKYGLSDKCYYIYGKDEIEDMRDDPGLKTVYAYGMQAGGSYIQYCYKKSDLDSFINELVARDEKFINKQH